MASYETVTVTIGKTKGPALKQKPNGECVYLDENGCTIHDRAPAVCRAYSCVGQYMMLTRAERRRRIARGLLKKEIMVRARELLDQQCA